VAGAGSELSGGCRAENELLNRSSSPELQPFASTGRFATKVRAFSISCPQPAARNPAALNREAWLELIEIAQGDSIRQGRPLNTNQMPAAINPAPAINDKACPLGVTFSARIKIAIAAIHDTFITPPTSSSAINVQQQPTQ
jgi:hypothetical protein